MVPCLSAVIRYTPSTANIDHLYLSPRYICGVATAPTEEQTKKLLDGYELSDGFAKALKVELVATEDIPNNPHIAHLLEQITQSRIEHPPPSPRSHILVVHSY